MQSASSSVSAEVRIRKTMMSCVRSTTNLAPVSSASRSSAALIARLSSMAIACPRVRETETAEHSPAPRRTPGSRRRKSATSAGSVTEHVSSSPAATAVAYPRLLLRIIVGNLALDVVGCQKSARVAADQVHAINPEEVDQDRRIRNDNRERHRGWSVRPASRLRPVREDPLLVDRLCGRSP